MRLQVGDPDSFDYQVFINGKSEILCYMADDELGEALVYVEGNDIPRFVKKFPAALIHIPLTNAYDIMATIKCKVEFKRI